MTTENKKTRPTHRVYAVSKKQRDDRGQWREIGVLWPHKDGKGFNLKLDLVPLNDVEIVIRTIDSAEGGAA